MPVCLRKDTVQALILPDLLPIPPAHVPRVRVPRVHVPRVLIHPVRVPLFPEVALAPVVIPIRAGTAVLFIREMLPDRYDRPGPASTNRLVFTVPAVIGRPITTERTMTTFSSPSAGPMTQPVPITKKVIMMKTDSIMTVSPLQKMVDMKTSCAIVRTADRIRL